jgi:hypothetical protein
VAREAVVAFRQPERRSEGVPKAAQSPLARARRPSRQWRPIPIPRHARIALFGWDEQFEKLKHLVTVGVTIALSRKVAGSGKSARRRMPGPEWDCAERTIAAANTVGPLTATRSALRVGKQSSTARGNTRLRAARATVERISS